MKKTKNATIKELKKIILRYLLKIFVLPFKLFSIKRTRVMFVSLTGGQYMEYSCNPKYVYEALRDDKGVEYEYIWAFSHPEKYTFLEEQGVKLVKHFSLKAIYYLLTSKVVVSGGSYLPWIDFRKEQVVIDTWHGGGAYKRLDREDGLRGKMVDKLNKSAGKHVTAFITSSDKFTQHVIQDTFGFEGEILKTGMPRNDFLVRQDTEAANVKVRKYYEIAEDVSICMYAPTYRENGKYKKLNMRKVRKQLEKTTGRKWLCLARGHRYESARLGKDADGILDVADYPDMQELLAAADMLITDYSSSIWDYSFLERPCYLYVSDLDVYRQMCGFYMDIDEWQIPYAVEEKDMLAQIACLAQIDWTSKMQAHRKALGSCESGHASQDIADYIKSKCIK